MKEEEEEKDRCGVGIRFVGQSLTGAAGKVPSSFLEARMKRHLQCVELV